MNDFFVSLFVSDFKNFLKGTEKTTPTPGPNKSLQYLSLLKGVILLLLLCDIFYLHVSLQTVDASLQSSMQIIDNLESQLKISRFNFDNSKADVNYLTYLNRILTRDINSKLELLLKLNKLFVDQTDTSLSAAIDIIRNQRNNDDEIINVVKRRSKYFGDKTSVHGANKVIPSSEPDDVYETSLFKPAIGETSNLILSQDNSTSLLDDFNFENSDMDSSAGLRNVSFKGMLTSGESHRIKRQTVNNSRSSNRGKHNGKLKKKRGHHHVNCNLFCCSAGKIHNIYLYIFILSTVLSLI